MVVGAEQVGDLFLFLLALREMGQIAGRTRLQKTVYLLREHYGIPFSFHFKPYFYGPYSEELSDSVDNLKALGMIEERRRYLTEGVIEYSYRLTKAGASFLEANVTADVVKRPPLGGNLAKATRELGHLATQVLVATAKATMASSMSGSR